MRATIETQMAKVLAAHTQVGETGRYWGGGRWKVECDCGHVSKYKGTWSAEIGEQVHAAHQAEMIAPLLQAAQAAVLEQAAKQFDKSGSIARYSGSEQEMDTWLSAATQARTRATTIQNASGRPSLAERKKARR